MIKIINFVKVKSLIYIYKTHNLIKKNMNNKIKYNKIPNQNFIITNDKNLVDQY